MNIGILDEYREKQLTGVNRVVTGSLTELIKHSDEALYEIKHSTKNGIKFY